MASIPVDEIARRMRCDPETAVKLVLAAGGDSASIDEEVWLDFLRAISKRLSNKKLKGGRGIIVCVRDDFKCRYCGSEKDLTFDHVIPKCKGGSSGYRNLALACWLCNQLKNDLDLDDFLDKLHKGEYKKDTNRLVIPPLSVSLAERLRAKGYTLTQEETACPS